MLENAYMTASSSGNGFGNKSQTVLMTLTQLHKLHPLLSKFSLDAVATIMQRATLIRLEPEQVLYDAGDLALKVYLIVYGTFELLRASAQTGD